MGEPEGIIAEVQAIAAQAGEIALRYFGRVSAELKHDESYVTEADKQVEEFIRRQLGARFPRDGIIGEEFDRSRAGTSDWTWAIDPIDGTTNFVAGLPHWAVCIARLRDGRSELGVTNVPVLGEMYTAARGHGALLNGRALQIPDRLPPEHEQLLAVWSTAFRHITLEFPGKVRILGSTVLKLLYTARGAYIGALTPTVHVWDVASGLPVLWEAGGEARSFDGTLYEAADMDPAHGYAVPPLVLARPGLQKRVRELFTVTR